LPPHGHHGLHVSAVLDGSAASRLLDLHPQQHRHHRVLLSAGLSESAFCVLGHDSAVAVVTPLTSFRSHRSHHRTLCNVSATARELFVFSAFLATRSEHTSMTAATISACFSYLHLHSRSAPGERPRLVRLAKPLECSSWHHAFTILGSSRRPLGVLLHLFFLYLLSLGCTRHHWFHHLGAFFASLSSSYLWLHHGAFFASLASSRFI